MNKQTVTALVLLFNLLLASSISLAYEIDEDKNYQTYLKLVNTKDRYKSIKYGEMALAAAKKELAADNLSLIQMKHDLGKVKSTFVHNTIQDQDMDASTLLEEALVGYRKLGDSHFEDVTEVLYSLGEVYVLKGNWYVSKLNKNESPRKNKKIGLIYFEEAISHIAVKHAADSLDMARLRLRIGKRLVSYDVKRKAVKLYLEPALRVFREKLGETSQDFGSAAFYIARSGALNKANRELLKLVLNADAADKPYYYEGKKHKYKKQKYDAAKTLALFFIQRKQHERATPFLHAMGRLVPRVASKTPSIIYKPDSRFPVTQEEGGTVDFHLTIDRSGRVSDLSVVNREGSKRFEVAAREAVKYQRYVPAMVDGEPVETKRLPFRFHYYREKPKHNFDFQNKENRGS